MKERKKPLSFGTTSRILQSKGKGSKSEKLRKNIPPENY